MKNVIQMVRNMVGAPGNLPVQPAAVPPQPAAVPQASTVPAVNVLDYYVTEAPDPQNALDIFKGEWLSKLPEPLATLQAGSISTFEDARIEWAQSQLGAISGKTVLELGPLEAGHTYMIEHFGAAEIVSIEANTRAYLKCLIVKELFDLKRVRFLCGDFIEYLRLKQARFDICVASGVLYHMRNPAELIALIAEATDKLFIWTHYYDERIISSNPGIAVRFPSKTPAEHQGFKHTLHRYEYLTALNFANFCGGSDVYSNWMTRDDILACLEFFGFGDIRVGLEQPDHIHGPAFCLTAIRR